ncbi:hypothetical protein Defa_27610 [Desulfovibrio sp. TH_2024_36128]|uniref:Uncharacterized protein n=1 Tax=Desulfovibrio falkowii TaxID=3136602 RepID=A0ABQ0EBT3_9BACT
MVSGADAARQCYAGGHTVHHDNPHPRQAGATRGLAEKIQLLPYMFMQDGTLRQRGPVPAAH